MKEMGKNASFRLRVDHHTEHEPYGRGDGILGHPQPQHARHRQLVRVGFRRQSNAGKRNSGSPYAYLHQIRHVSSHRAFSYSPCPVGIFRKKTKKLVRPVNFFVFRYSFVVTMSRLDPLSNRLQFCWLIAARFRPKI